MVHAVVTTGTTALGLEGPLREQVAGEIELLFIAAVYGDVKDNEEGVLVIGRKKKYVV